MISSAQIQEKYKRMEKVGEGTFGIVHKVQIKGTNKFGALKKIKLDLGDDDEGVPSTTIREISILKQISKQDCKNVVKLLDTHYLVNEKELYLLFEFVQWDLKKHIDENMKLLNIKQSIEEARGIIYQLLNGVDCLHKNRILHRDLKPQNVLIDVNKKVKIADFGLSRTFNVPLGKFTRDIATLWYRPPELMLGDEDYSISIDMWAVGCILAELILKKPLFYGDSQIDMLFKVFECFGTPDESNYPKVSQFQFYKSSFPKFNYKGLEAFMNIQLNDPICLDLLNQLLQLNPLNRPTANQCLNHPFFSTLDKELF